MRETTFAVAVLLMLAPAFALPPARAADAPKPEAKEPTKAEEPKPEAPPKPIPTTPMDESQEGFIPLFNGKDLTGWVQRGGKAKYRVEDDAIVGTTVPNTTNTFLCTTKDYGDFILELEFKVNPKMNSGVQIRSHVFDEEKKYEWNGKEIKVAAGRVHGYQVEIDPSSRAWTAGIYDEGRRGWLYDLKDNPPAQKAFKQGEWNKVHVECKGDTIRTWLNGVPASDLKDGMTPSGFIALQVHAVGKDVTEPEEVAWKNIRIKELK